MADDPHPTPAGTTTAAPPATPDPEHVYDDHHAPTIARNARYGLWLFAIYFAVSLLLCIAAAADEPPSPVPDRPSATLHGHGGRGVAFSSDGARLVTQGDRAAQVWDVATGRTLGPPAEHDRQVVDAALDAAGGRLLTAWGSSAYVRDVATGEVLHKWAHDAEVRSASFDAAGRRVLTAGGGEVRVWDAGTGERLWMAQHAARLHSAEFAAGDTRVLAVVYRSAADMEQARPNARHRFHAAAGRALLWDSTTGVLLRQFDADVGPAEFAPDAVLRPAALSDDGAALIRGTGSGFVVVDMVKGGLLADRHTKCNEQWAHDYPIVGGYPGWFAFQPDGRGFLTLGEMAPVALWDLPATAPQLPEAARGGNWEVARFAAGGARLLLAGRGGRSGALVLDVASGEVLLRQPAAGGNDPARQVAISPDGRYVAAVAGRDTAVWAFPAAAAAPADPPG